ncbi:hypothetical protein [Micromonospora sp. DH14]|uniref:hypothetical protein n=1 Tax=Micromonospora sp. DH14 TaxID=3040120 RepID=UPI002441291C|nr:hypothetical protein [Micromonospora sp. DH14]MDG9672554.1 hypothetical protein [Micromonospora sp. DH14]
MAIPASGASAAPPSVKESRSVQFSAAELTANATRASDSRTVDAKAARVQEHLDLAARNGRLIDKTKVSVSTVEDPFNRGEQVMLTWEGYKSPESITYARRGGEGSPSTTAMGIQLGGAKTVDLNRAGPKANGGSGYSAAVSTSNMYKEDGSCATTWFVPGYASSKDHKLTSCYELWAQDKTVHFVYNRWSLWQPAPASAIDEVGKTTDFYVASRPWRGHEYKLVDLNGWKPSQSELTKTCTTVATATIGGTYGAVTGNVAIPINRCEHYDLDITASTRRVGIDFNGTSSNNIQMDVAGDYDAVNATVLPVWADYNWVEVQWCWAWGAICDPPTPWVAKDSGW